MSEITKPIVLDESIQTTNRLLSALVRQGMKTDSIDWALLGDVANEEIFDRVYEIGDQFVDEWKDAASNQTYSVPWNYVHSEDVELSDGEILKNRPFIQWHYCTPFGVQFSHQRAFLRCPNGLAPGTYTIHFAQTWSKFTQLVWNFTTTVAVPNGGRVSGFYNGADNASGYKVYTHSADGKTVLESIDPVAGSAGTDLGTLNYVTRNGDLNCMQEAFYGYNRWAKSALRQYLNSYAGTNNWWVAQDDWDIAPNELGTKAGFLSGCSESFINSIKPVKVTTYRHSNDAEGNGADITYDKVFLPSLEQIYVNPQVSGEGTAFEYWKRRSGSATPLAQFGTYPNMITYAVNAHTSAQLVTLRSCYRSNAYYRWHVNSSGIVNGYSAYSSHRFSPLCVL